MRNPIGVSVISGADHRRRRDGILLAPRGGKERDVSNRAREIGEADRGNESVIDGGAGCHYQKNPDGQSRRVLLSEVSGGIYSLANAEGYPARAISR